MLFSVISEREMITNGQIKYSNHYKKIFSGESD
jgi:hypothetical protein